MILSFLLLSSHCLSTGTVPEPVDDIVNVAADGLWSPSYCGSSEGEVWPQSRGSNVHELNRELAEGTDSESGTTLVLV
jgi:hypothetical protein